MRKTGFTLIELLAVIVILAIIALIAVPIVLNIINDSKKESLQRSIDLYIATAEKAIAKYQMTHRGFKPDKCEIQSNGNLMCGEETIEVEVKGQIPESGTITIADNKIYYDVVLEGMEYILDETGKKDPITYEPSIQATNQDYRGYYADVDGDGEADGVIYADLGANITYPITGDFYNDTINWNQGGGTYSYAKETGLKEYRVSKDMYKKNDGFGMKPIISVKKGSTGNARFYVMALEDFTTTDYTRFYWYKNAYGKMSTYADDTKTDFGKGYSNTRKIIEIWNKNGTGEGSYSGATQDNRDIWKHIQDKYAEGWYIPSRGEWGAFADYLKQKTENKLTNNCSTSLCGDNGNYDDIYGLSSWYWSSSLYGTNGAWGIYFYYGRMDNYDVNRIYGVRLGVTF